MAESLRRGGTGVIGEDAASPCSPAVEGLGERCKLPAGSGAEPSNRNVCVILTDVDGLWLPQGYYKFVNICCKYLCCIFMSQKRSAVIYSLRLAINQFISQLCKKRIMEDNKSI